MNMHTTYRILLLVDRLGRALATSLTAALAMAATANPAIAGRAADELARHTENALDLDGAFAAGLRSQ